MALPDLRRRRGLAGAEKAGNAPSVWFHAGVAVAEDDTTTVFGYRPGTPSTIRRRGLGG